MPNIHLADGRTIHAPDGISEEALQKIISSLTVGNKQTAPKSNDYPDVGEIPEAGDVREMANIAPGIVEGSKQAYKQVGRPALELGSMMVATALQPEIGLPAWAVRIGMGGLGLSVGGGTADVLEQKNMNPKDFSEARLKDFATGAGYEAVGPPIGWVIGKGAGFASDLADMVSSKFGNTKALEKAVGRSLLDSLGNVSKATEEQFAANKAVTENLMKKIPGFKPGTGQVENRPGLLQWVRGRMRQMPTKAADAIQERVASNQDALYSYLGKYFPEGTDVQNVLGALREVSEANAKKVMTSEEALGTLAKAVEGLPASDAIGDMFRTTIDNARKIVKDNVSKAWDKLPDKKLLASDLRSRIVKVLKEHGEELEDAGVLPGEWLGRVMEKTKPIKKTVKEFSPGTMQTVEKVIEKDPGITFKQLRKIRSGLSNKLRDLYRQGEFNKARWIKKLRDAVDESINKAGEGVPQYDEARKLYADYASRFQNGPVGKALGYGEDAYKITDSKVARLFYDTKNPEYYDSLVNAVGKGKAQELIKTQALADLRGTAYRAGDKTLDPKAINRWYNNNYDLLERAGLGNYFKNFDNVAKDLQKAMNANTAFQKTVFEKVTGYDADEVIKGIFSGEGVKSSEQTAKTLLKLLGNSTDKEAAINGLRAATKDYLLDETATTALDIFNKPIKSYDKFVKLTKRMRPAMKVIFTPKQLEAMDTFQKAMDVAMRGARSQVGAGSVTSETLADIARQNFMPVLWRHPKLRVLVNLLSGVDDTALQEIIINASFDPVYADRLMNMAKVINDRPLSLSKKFPMGMIAARKAYDKTQEQGGM